MSQSLAKNLIRLTITAAPFRAASFCESGTQGRASLGPGLTCPHAVGVQEVTDCPNAHGIGWRARGTRRGWGRGIGRMHPAFVGVQEAALGAVVRGVVG